MSTRAIPKWPQSLYRCDKHGSHKEYTHNTIYNNHHIRLELTNIGYETIMMRMYLEHILGPIGWCTIGPKRSDIHQVVYRDRLIELHDRISGDFDLGDMPTMDKVIQYFFPNYYMELLL